MEKTGFMELLHIIRHVEAAEQGSLSAKWSLASLWNLFGTELSGDETLTSEQESIVDRKIAEWKTEALAEYEKIKAELEEEKQLAQ